MKNIKGDKTKKFLQLRVLKKKKKKYSLSTNLFFVLFFNSKGKALYRGCHLVSISRYKVPSCGIFI